MEDAELVPDLIGTYEVTDMESKRIMLQTWNQSAGVMHIAHHLAAARYAGRHRIFGSFTAAMSALVSVDRWGQTRLKLQSMGSDSIENRDQRSW